MEFLKKENEMEEITKDESSVQLTRYVNFLTMINLLAITNLVSSW